MSSSELFYSALHSEIDIDDTTSSDKKCLISHTPLEDYFQTLSCGHSFNYAPLYKHIYHSQTPKSYGTIPLGSPGIFKCPYCRKVQYKLIPYIPLEGVSEIYGVNTTKLYTFQHTTCMFTNGSNKKCRAHLLRQLQPGMYYCRSHYKIQKELSEAAPINPTVDLTPDVNIPTIPDPVIVNTDFTTCTYVFVKGIRKNTACGACVVGSDSFCKKHTKKVTV